MKYLKNKCNEGIRKVKRRGKRIDPQSPKNLTDKNEMNECFKKKMQQINCYLYINIKVTLLN